jgi:hypothetical protein
MALFLIGFAMSVTGLVALQKGRQRLRTPLYHDSYLTGALMAHGIFGTGLGALAMFLAVALG